MGLGVLTEVNRIDRCHITSEGLHGERGHCIADISRITQKDTAINRGLFSSVLGILNLGMKEQIEMLDESQKQLDLPVNDLVDSTRQRAGRLQTAVYAINNFFSSRLWQGAYMTGDSKHFGLRY